MTYDSSLENDSPHWGQFTIHYLGQVACLTIQTLLYHIKARTLSPKWNEEFILDVNRIDDDALRIDVWDFNWDENVTDKFRKINEIKERRSSVEFIGFEPMFELNVTQNGRICYVYLNLMRPKSKSGTPDYLSL